MECTDKISVIVPTYNNAPWLSACIDSILAQTYQNIEIIIVDDGSTDHTASILDRLASEDNRIKVIRKENGGVTSARLRGVREASGNWIGFVDGDDVIESDMYRRLLENAQRYKAEISHCGYQMVFSDGRVHYFHNTGTIAKHDRNTALCALLSGTIIEPGLCNKLFRRELLKKLIAENKMPQNIRINEDLLMNFILFRHASASVFEDICPYHYRVRKGSASRQPLNQNKIYDPIKVKKYILSLSPPEVCSAAQAAYLSTCINIYNGIVLDNRKDLGQEQKNIRQFILSHYKWASLLSQKQRFLARLIRFTPWIYRSLYYIYATYFLQNPYE